MRLRLPLFFEVERDSEQRLPAEKRMSGSPRPSFDRPTHIPYEQATRHVWGDEISGKVIDWIYVSSTKIHQLVFSMPFGGRFGHSDTHRTIFAADELYYVLSGTFLMTNPETGEVHRVNKGEAAFFQHGTMASTTVQSLCASWSFLPPRRLRARRALMRRLSLT